MTKFKIRDAQHKQSIIRESRCDFEFCQNENGIYENIQRCLLFTIINNENVLQIVDEDCFIIIFNPHNVFTIQND